MALRKTAGDTVSKRETWKKEKKKRRRRKKKEQTFPSM